MISEGQKAPDFSLPGVEGDDPAMYNLVEHIESAAGTVLVFVPSGHAPVCEDDLRALGASNWPDRDDLLVWAITGDSIFANAAAAERLGLEFPVISDFHAGIAEAYGLMLEDWHGHWDIPGRGVIVVAPDWTVQYSWAAADPFDVPRASPFEGAAGALERLGVDVEPIEVDYRVEG